MPDLSSVNILSLLLDLLLKGLFSYSIIKTLQQMQVTNQKIKPQLVWLLMVPGLSFVWNFVVTYRISKSVKSELESRNFEVNNNPLFTIGMIFSCLSLTDLALSMVAAYALIDPKIAALIKTYTGVYEIFAIVTFIIFIQYWVRINWYRRVLVEDANHHTEL